MKRRDFLHTAAAFGLTAATSSFPFHAQAKVVSEGENSRIMTLSDGHLRLPLSFIFPDVTQDELQSLIAGELVDEEYVEPGLNLTLLQSGERVVLFDVGSGPNFMPSAGKLADSMNNAGIAPEMITDVLFTHAHPDHLWGILDDFDEVIFPEATLHVPQKEFEFWMNDNTVNLMPDSRKAFAVGAKNRLEVMKEQVSLFEAGSELVAGIESFDTSGHTPGHTSYIIHGTGEPVVVLGDALTNHLVSFQKPMWKSGSDQDPDQGIKTRLRLLDKLAIEQIKMIGYHLPNDGVGLAEKSNSAYKFIEI